MSKHTDDQLRFWAVFATQDRLHGLLADTVLRMAFVVTGKRFTRRAEAEAAILAAQSVGA